MPRRELLSNLQAALGEAVGTDSADGLGRARAVAARMIGYALLRRSSEDLRIIESMLARVHTELLLKHGWTPTPDLKTQTWMLAAAAKIAGVVAGMLPQRAPTLDKEQGTKRSAILMALAASNVEHLSNSDLVDRVDARAETVARILEVLRSEGLVESWRRGRTTLNRLTAEGIIAAREARSREERIEEPIAVESEQTFANVRARFSDKPVLPTFTQPVALAEQYPPA